jgi:hypothetical protein
MERHRARIDALATGDKIDPEQFITSLLPSDDEYSKSRLVAVMRMLLAEGLHIPSIAEFYYKEVLSQILGLLREQLQRAAKAGMLINPEVAHFPQLLEAPLMLAVIWSGLFDRFEKLDVREMLRVHLQCIFKPKADTEQTP